MTLVCAGLLATAMLVGVGPPHAARRLQRRLPPVAVVPALRGLARRRGARRRRGAECVDVLRALAAELRSGASAAAALAAAAESADDLRPLLLPAAAAVARGAAPDVELGRVAMVPGCDRFGPAATTWQVAQRHGAPLSALLDRLADAYDASDVARDDVEASVAGARATMLLLAVLPGAGLALGEALGAHPARWLLSRPLGGGLVAVSVVLDAVGMLWVRRIMRLR